MTYLFKLARRIAKIRLPLGAALLGALGCSKGDKTDFLAPNPNQNTPVLNSIRVEPQVTSVRVGSELQFTATGYTAAGLVIPVTVDWSAVGGIITPDGRYTGVLTGSFVVRATARARAGVADSARVGVWDNTTDLVALVVSPDSAVIEVGDSLDFTAALEMASGAMTGSANVTWSSTGGQISPTGRFTSAVAGQFTVSAVSVNNLRGSARINVQEHQRTLARVRLTPDAATVVPGGSVQFAATAEYADGSTGAADAEWQATGGTIAQGLYTATNGGGQYLVIARDRAGILADTAVVTVPMPTLTRLVVSPAAPILAPGAMQQFSAQAQMSDNSWQVVPLLWSATAGVIGTDGAYTAAGSEGTARVIVRSPGSPVADTAVVSVVAPPAELAKVNLNPSSATVAAGSTRQFTVSGVWSNGGTSTPTVTWSGTGGTISPNGLFTAGAIPGTYSVTATASNGKADTSGILVTDATLTSLQLSPASVAREPGQSQQFSVSGTWSNGSTAAPSVTYLAAGGSITAGGLYVAGSTAGTFAVIATQQGGALADTSLVTISTPAPTLTGVVLTPTSVVLDPGGVQQFSAVGLYSNGTTGSISISWSETGGSINSSGRYTAGSTPGTYRVIARQSGNTRADTSVVTITSPPIVTSVTISPKPTSLQVSTTAQFTASATWSNGSTTVPPISWAATGGTVNSSGLYSAGATAGIFRVVATHQGGTRADTSVVTLTAVPPPPVTLTGLVISPKPASVPVNTTRQFSVTGVWSDGVSRTVSVSYAATGGTISVGGLYTAGTVAGTFAVIASCACGVADTAAVLVTAVVSPPTLTSLAIEPKPVSLQTSGTQQFTASALWSDGATTLPSLTWSATGGTISSSGLYTAGGTAGTFRAIAATDGKADTAVVTLNAPVVTDFVMTPASVSLAAGATQQFATAATWSDGAVRPVTVTYSATGGGISVGGLYTAGLVAGTFSAIASCSCGKADTSTVSIAAVPVPTLLSLQVGPNPVSVYTGGSQAFSAIASWSDGSSALPTLSWSATGGTISSSGAYTAAGSVGTFRVVASGGGRADTAAVAVLVPPVSGNPVTGGGAEPSGFLTAIATRFNFAPPVSPSTQDSWSQVGATGTLDPANATTVTDMGAPYGSTVMRLSFPPTSNGQSLGGNAPVWMHNGGWSGGPRLYIRVRMKIDARWTNMGNGGAKLIFIRNSSQTDNHYVGYNLEETDSPTTMTIAAGWQGTGDSKLSLWHRPSLGSVNLVDGQYHDLEWLITPEGVAGQETGRIDTWVDGVKQNFSYGWENNIRMFNPGDARLWNGIEIQPTFGGGIKDPPNYQPPIWWNIASVYVSTGN